MKKSNKIVSFLFSMLSIAFFTALAVPVLGQGALVVGGAGYLYSIAPSLNVLPMDTLHNEVIRRNFETDLQQRLYPDNSFYSSAQKDSGIDLDADLIEIPQDEDGEIEVIHNPKVFPLQTIVEEDKKKSYGTTLLATPPQLVTLDNQLMVSYDKRTAKLRKHENTIRKQVAEIILNGWSPTKEELIRKTTSTNTRTVSLKGATGLRKRISLEDFMWARRLMNEQDLPLEGRRVVITPAMEEDLLLIGKDFIKAADLIEAKMFTEGSIGRILGFDIFLRSSTQGYSTAVVPVKRAVKASILATDSAAAIFFHPAFVRYAEGKVKVFMDPNERGEMLGKTMNVSVRAGSTQSRLSELGVLALVEATV